MPTCGRHALAPAIQSITRVAPRRLLRASSRPSSTLSHSPGFPNASPSSPTAYLRKQKFNDLRESLLRGDSPSRVWADYSDLLNLMGFEKLPLEVHQHVLRKCTPSSAELRKGMAKTLAAGKTPKSPHRHEGRFQTIIRNIRAAKASPDLDDYHFILEQFAAVGHHIGAMHVYKELTQVGIKPRSKTFGLCFQAIAHRMTFPVPENKKEHRSEEARRMMFDLVREMRNRRTPFTAANLDLTIRILKETLDMETFEELMKWGYGIDLSNPDRPPLEFLGPQNIKSDLGIQAQAKSTPTQQPFSTAALNTTIDILGRIGNVSKLVQAFEVLTQPLPHANDHMFSSFDDDEDFGVANTPHSVWIPPHASPNTTSYIMMIRHLCTLGHATLARHYAREAIYWDRQKDRVTKTKIKDCRDEIPAPKISVNRGTLLPILGLSNRTKNLTLTRWLTRKLPGVLRLKRYNLEYYSKYRERVQRQQAHKNRLLNRSPDSSAVDAVNTLSVDAPNSDASTTYTPVPEPTANLPKIDPLIERSRNKPRELDIFEIDIDSLPPIPPPSSREPVRLLDLDLHIRVLERDIAELEEFSKDVDDTLGRNTQRVKEGLGRRVWAGKGVYMADQNIRREVSREEWINTVGFRRERPRDLPPPPRPATMMVAKGRSPPPFFQNNQVTKTEVSQSVLGHLTSMPHKE
ncbi:hypothetical protein C0995_000884 [Termitomyces sp. Mi166|nr:hypothetical protein C0995_000884 [Termitomyces sp. Mi166\